MNNTIYRIDFKEINRMALSRAEYIISILLPDGKRQGNEWVSLNPKRNDSSPGSFKINIGSWVWSDFATGDKGGDLISLVAYLKGISQYEAAKFLADNYLGGAAIEKSCAEKNNHPNEKEAFTPVFPYPENIYIPEPGNLDEPLFKDKTHGKPKYIYCYKNRKGEILSFICRYEFFKKNEDGIEVKGKIFKSFTYGTIGSLTKWHTRAIPNNRPLYNLENYENELDLPVLIVEGEKAAEAAKNIFRGICWVTSSSNGSMSPHKTDWSLLKKRSIIICPDNDESGMSYQEKVTGILMTTGIATIKVIVIPAGFPDGWDLADPIPEGVCS